MGCGVQITRYGVWGMGYREWGMGNRELGMGYGV